jgi:capsular exopolysaccharide synthesis family protein
MEVTQYPENIDFSKYWLILKRRWLPASGVFLFVVLLSSVMTVLEKPVYEAQGKLLFKKRDVASTLLSDSTDKIGQLESLNQQNTPVDTEAEVLRSTPLIEKTIAALKLEDKKGNPVAPEAVIKSLTVKGIKGTDILLISYKSENPKEAAEIINQLINTYIESNISINRTEATAAREFITEQLPKTESALRQAEIAIRLFDEQNNVINLQDESKSAVESMALLNQKITEVVSNLANTTTQSSVLRTKIGLTSQEAMTLNSLSQSSAVQQVLKELQATEGELSTQRTRYRGQHPTIVQLEQRQAALKALLQERITQVVGNREEIPSRNLQMGESAQKLIDSFVTTEVARLGLASQAQALMQAQSAYRERANLLPQLEQKRRDLERQVETAKSKYEILVKHLQEVQIAENQNVGNARVVASASPPTYPVASKKKLILAGGMIVGGLLYIVTAFVLDLRDPSIKTAKEAREYFNYPWLGMIPMLRRKQGFPSQKDLESSTPELPVRDMPSSLESEAYRMLQSNLKFLKPDQIVKTIVVTSSVSKEGKSTISANLAVALSQMGLRVLLVDADLHYPMQHHIWGLTNIVGLSDVIMNRTELVEAVKQVHDNLSVLPAGGIPPNPLALIDSNRMNSLVQSFSQNYDFVIFDTPPLVLVSDVLMLGRMTDGILLVTRPGVVDAASATTAKAQLTQSGLEVLGLVINGVDIRQEPDNYLRHIKAYHEDTASFSKAIHS